LPGRVLDPACGSGNFLYVALEHLKRLEGEVLDLAASFGETFRLELGKAHSVDPHQFLGIEINPRAAAITELVLWIGYLQWHFRTRGRQTMPEEPILKKFQNIECRDAVLAYDGEPQPAKDENGKEITVWDRHSIKKDPVTGREIPDETKRVLLLTYKNPRPAEWPSADFIVGNPPFLGPAKMREALGDGYAQTLRKAYSKVPESADFVLYWWYKAAELVRSGRAKRFGLITTNSLRQTFARRIVQAQLQASPPLSLRFAIPDHPWVESSDGAAVRIAMTVGSKGPQTGELCTICKEAPKQDGSSEITLLTLTGPIQEDLTIGAEVSSAKALKANQLLASRGVMLGGAGFILTPDEARRFGYGVRLDVNPIIRPYRHGRDLNDEPRGVLVIDVSGYEREQLRDKFPEIYQHLLTTVKPEREQNADPKLRSKWWLFRRSNEEIRRAISGLHRYTATTETSKHRFFQFLDSSILPDNMLVAIGLDDAFNLGVLSSRIHVVFALASGGTLEDRPRYNKSRCFDPFPFPECDETTKDRMRKIAEELDAHRKRVQAQNPGLTLTGMYNVLEKLRASEPLNEKELRIHDQGLVSVLRQLHEDLDAAAFAAYGWPVTLTDAEILERLVALNAERAKEESNGLIRWLRPEYQNPGGTQSQQTSLAVDTSGEKPSAKLARKNGKLVWPKTMAERVKAVSLALAAHKEPVSIEAIAKRFARAKANDIFEILETLCTMGHAHHGKTQGTYVP
jgi:hypothetical protein